MRIRRRLALSAGLAVAVAIALASGAAYVAVRATLRSEIDHALRNRSAALRDFLASRNSHGRLPPVPDAARFGGAAGYVELVSRSGVPERLPRSPAAAALPVDARVLAIAAGRGETTMRDEHVAGSHLRVLTAPLRGGGALQVARPLAETDHSLRRLALILAAITLGGIVVASGLGGTVARAALAPVRRFTDRTEEIAEQPDLGARLPELREDELGRLAHSFNRTLDALERSLAAQRRLVADASHELRTPLATLRTNLELLARGGALPEEERRELIGELVGQIDELTLLVGDVVELARRGEPPQERLDVSLDEVVTAAVAKARRHAPAVSFDTRLEATTVRGDAARIDRAVANLLDNAAKWSPPGGHVEVVLSGGELTVTDEGPGFDASDMPFVFDRFYRASAARGMRGSGLGLAIVKQVVEAHGGSVRAENAGGRGARLSARFPAETDERAARPAAPLSPLAG